MLGGGLKNGMARADQGAQVRQQGIEVGLDRLKQLCNGRHDTSTVARS
jgi:hypothetical protein